MEKLMQHKSNCNRAIWGSILVFLSICAVFFLKGSLPVYAEEEGISATRYIETSDGGRREYIGDSSEDGTYVVGDKLKLSIEINGLSKGQYVEYQWYDDNWNEIDGAQTNTLDITKRYNPDDVYSDGYSCSYTVFDADNNWVEQDNCYFYIVTKQTIADYTSYITYNGKKYTSWSSDANQLNPKVGDKIQLSIEEVETEYENAKLTYQWYKQVKTEDGYYEDKKLENETKDTIEVTKGTVQTEIYRCLVSDGNNAYYIEVSVPATKTLKVAQKMNGKDYDNEDSSNNEFVVGDNVTLKIDATSEYIPEGEDKANITYQWLQYSDEDGYSEMEGKTDDSYTFTKGMGTEHFACTVSDGNETFTYYFYAYSKATLDCDAYINYNNKKYNTWDDFSMPVGAEAELMVEASSDYGTVNYKWFKYNYDTDEWDSLKGTDSSITVKKTFRGQEQYRCIINDGNDKKELNFYLPAEKTLTVVQKINDKEYNSDEDSSYPALKGTSLKLEVDATSTYIPEGEEKATITYQWYKSGYNGENGYTEIKGANTSTYVFEKAAGSENYSCEVYDGNPDGSSRTYYFYISNTQTLKNTRGDITYNNNKYDRYEESFNVKEGAALTLTASAKTKIENGTVSYQWMKMNEDGVKTKIEKANTNTLAIKKEGIVREIYYCLISDGNDERELEYYIPAVQTLSIKAQKINGKEIYRYTAEKGTNITLSVEAESSYTDKNGNKPELTYEWRDDYGNDDDVYNEKTSSYTFKKQTGTQNYYCTVSDGINSETVNFYLYQKDTLKATPYINDEDTDEITAVEGNSYTLSVKASSTKSSDIKYEWYKEDESGDDVGYPNADNICQKNSITVKKSSSKEDRYRVTVSDGNKTKNYYFILYLENADDTDYINMVQYINDDYYEDYMRYAAEKFPITLKVEASAESGKNLTYQWQKSEDYEENYENITTAKGNTCEVSSLEAKRMYYRCIVTSGNSEDTRRTAEFVLVKPDTIKLTQDVKVNGTSVKPSDDEGTYIVKEGSEVNLTVNAQKTDSSTADFTYLWKDSEGDEIKTNASAPNVCTIKNFDTSGSYTCTVSDGKDTQEAYFYLEMPENSQDKEIITIKPFINGKETRELEISSANDAVELKVEATSNKNNKALQYEWSWDDDDDYMVPVQKGGNTYKLTSEDLTSNYCYIRCRVKGTENTEYCDFYIYLKNYTYDFSSVITKAGKQQKTNNIRAAQGDSLKLELVPYADSNADKKVSYAWYNKEGKKLSGTSSVTVTKSTGKEIYYCKVNDGNYTRTYNFTLYPEEALIADAVINGNTGDEYAAKAGETVKLEAIASSPKPVTYTWYRRGTTWEKLAETTSQLSRKVEKPETYVCVVKNEDSLVRLYFYIYITNKDTSDTPNTPSNPDTPNTPSNPTTPTKPSTPAKPTTPAKPSKPTLKVGTKVTDKKTKAVYKVTGKNTVEYVKTTSKATSITIPATVTVKGVKCQVKSIAAKAFKGNKKIKKLTIPASVRKIGKQAFVNCKNLKTITIKTPYLTSKTVGAGAFKGIHAKAVIKVPKKQLKAYKKLLKSKGIGKKVVVKK